MELILCKSCIECEDAQLRLFHNGYEWALMVEILKFDNKDFPLYLVVRDNMEISWRNKESTEKFYKNEIRKLKLNKIKNEK